MSKRRRAREMAVQMLFQSDLGSVPADQVFRHFDPLGSSSERDSENGGGRERRQRPGEAEDSRAAFEYAKALVTGTCEHRQEIDDLIAGQADNWRLERMSAVDRNILRLAVYEFLYEIDVPKLVVLDEAIELAKKFGSEHSGRFVNGVLDGLLKSHRFPGKLT